MSAEESGAPATSIYEAAEWTVGGGLVARPVPDAETTPFPLFCEAGSGTECRLSLPLPLRIGEGTRPAAAAEVAGRLAIADIERVVRRSTDVSAAAAGRTTSVLDSPAAG